MGNPPQGENGESLKSNELQKGSDVMEAEAIDLGDFRVESCGVGMEESSSLQKSSILKGGLFTNSSASVERTFWASWIFLGLRPRRQRGPETHGKRHVFHFHPQKPWFACKKARFLKVSKRFQPFP